MLRVYDKPCRLSYKHCCICLLKAQNGTYPSHLLTLSFLIKCLYDGVIIWRPSYFLLYLAWQLTLCGRGWLISPLSLHSCSCSFLSQYVCSVFIVVAVSRPLPPNKTPEPGLFFFIVSRAATSLLATWFTHSSFFIAWYPHHNHVDSRAANVRKKYFKQLHIVIT